MALLRIREGIRTVGSWHDPSIPSNQNVYPWLKTNMDIYFGANDLVDVSDVSDVEMRGMPLLHFILVDDIKIIVPVLVSDTSELSTGPCFVMNGRFKITVIDGNGVNDMDNPCYMSDFEFPRKELKIESRGNTGVLMTDLLKVRDAFVAAGLPIFPSVEYLENMFDSTPDRRGIWRLARGN